MSSEHWHRVSVLDANARTGECSVCGPVKLRRRVRRGKVEWACMVRHLQYPGSSGNTTGKFYGKPHRRHLGDTCRRCGFVPVHVAQLDAHHIDGNHQNNSAANIATLCANCHRLEHLPAGALHKQEVTPDAIRVLLDREQAA